MRQPIDIDSLKLSSKNREYFLKIEKIMKLQSKKPMTINSYLYKTLSFIQAQKRLNNVHIVEDITTTTQNDIEDWFLSVKGKQSDATLSSTLRAVKVVLQTLTTKEHTDEITKTVKIRPIRQRDPYEDFLTIEDVKKIIQSETSLRNKAIIMTLFDTGIRVGELCNIKINDLHVNEGYASLKVSGKTGERNVIVIAALPYIIQHLNQHLYADEPDAPLFNCLHRVADGYLIQTRKPMQEKRVLTITTTAGERAGIKKPTNPHAFRRAWTTANRDRLNQEELEDQGGWVHGSTVISRVYSKVDMQKLIQKRLAAAGADIPTEKPPITVKVCHICGEHNAVTDKVCRKCHAYLDKSFAYDSERILRIAEERADQMQEMLSKLYALPEYQDILSDKLKEPHVKHS